MFDVYTVMLISKSKLLHCGSIFIYCDIRCVKSVRKVVLLELVSSSCFPRAHHVLKWFEQIIFIGTNSSARSTCAIFSENH